MTDAPAQAEPTKASEPAGPSENTRASETTRISVSRRTATVAGRTWVDVAVVLVLATIAMVGFGTAFDSWTYLAAGVGGMLVGAAAALVAARLRFNTVLTILLAIVAYFLFGSAIAVPGQATAFVLPNLVSLASLSIGAVNGWADLVTLRAPVSLPEYVTAVPYIAGWAVALVSVTLAARFLPRKTRTPWRASLLLIGPAALYVAGVLLGTEQAYYAGIRGIAFAALALVWLGWRRREGKSLAVAGSNALLRRKLFGTAIVVLFAVLAGVVGGAYVAPPAQSRFVLRDQVQPPFEPLQYPSPLAGFRKFTNRLTDKTLFTVKGMRAGQLLHLATLDTYDGVIWGVAGAQQETDSSGSFRLVGKTMPPPALITKNQVSKLDITVDDYSDVWVPDTGYPRRLAFEDAADAKHSADVRYNSTTGTTVLTSGLRKGAHYTLTADTQKIPDDKALAKVPVASFAPSPVSNIPDSVVAKAGEITSKAGSPIEKLRALQQYLSTTGYFSHGRGSDQTPSRAGHAADRMNEMATVPNMVGDQEQYASLFALMARSFNYPVRVVMGFAPEVPENSNAAIKVTGDDTTAWAEVAFKGVGWVPFFPTPKNPDVPQSQVPKPQTEPQPQVRQPPRTDAEQDDLITAVQINDSDDDKNPFFSIPAWVITLALSILIPALIIFGPMLVVAAIKRRRSRRRRAAAAGDLAAAGAWDEMLDRFSELGFAVPQRTTRIHVADSLERQLATTPAVHSGNPVPFENAPEAVDVAPPRLRPIATLTDDAVFSGRSIEQQQADQLWAEAIAAVAAASSGVGRLRRLLSRYRVSAARRWAARLITTATSAAPSDPRTTK